MLNLDTHILIKALEGKQPIVNARVVTAEGAGLAPGDVIEIAGARLEFGGVP